MKRILTIFSALTFTVATLCAQTLNVASYNVRTLNAKDYEHGDGWTQRVDYLCDVIRFSDFDIFGAQEVRYGQLTDMLARLDGYAYVGAGRDDGMTKGEYSPIFYKQERFVLLDSGTFWLSETPNVPSKGWDARYPRVCSWGYFKDKRLHRKFWFFNLHMDHKGIEARRESAKLIVAHIAKQCGKKANVILTGDFNVAQDNEIFRIFADCGFLHDAYEVAEVRFAPTGTFNSFKPTNYTTRRIDHIWVSDKIAVERYGVLTYHYWRDERGAEASNTDAPKDVKSESRSIHLPSDHYPINAFLRIGK